MFEHEIVLDPTREMVCLTCRGEANVQHAAQVSKEARTLAAQHGYGLLFDCRDVQLQIKTLDIYHYPREQDFLVDRTTKRVRTALLVSRGPELKSWLFYETTAQNVGVNVRVFVEDEAEAIAWLLS